VASLAHLDQQARATKEARLDLAEADQVVLPPALPLVLLLHRSHQVWLVTQRLADPDATARLTTSAQLDLPDQKDCPDEMDLKEDPDLTVSPALLLRTLPPKAKTPVAASTAHKDLKAHPAQSVDQGPADTQVLKVNTACQEEMEILDIPENQDHQGLQDQSEILVIKEKKEETLNTLLADLDQRDNEDHKERPVQPETKERTLNPVRVELLDQLEDLAHKDSPAHPVQPEKKAQLADLERTLNTAHAQPEQMKLAAMEELVVQADQAALEQDHTESTK